MDPKFVYVVKEGRYTWAVRVPYQKDDRLFFPAVYYVAERSTALELAEDIVANEGFDGLQMIQPTEPEELPEDACPGCGCRPGDGRTEGCENPDGCGYFRKLGDEYAWNGRAR